MHKVKPSTLTAGTAENNLKGKAERFVASDNSSVFMNSVNRTPTYSKQFLYDVLAMIHIIPNTVNC